MQLRGASMAILGVGATMALLNMAFHPLARMGALTHDASDLRAHSHRNRTRVRGAGALAGEAAQLQDVAVLQQPDVVVQSMAATTGAALAKIGAADIVAAQQARDAAAKAIEEAKAQAEVLAASVRDGITAAAAEPIAAEGAAQQQEPSSTSVVPVKTVNVVEDALAVVGRHPLQQRVCGSPAVDGYAHVVPQCLLDSPSAKWWFAWERMGGKAKDLVMHIERNADFDGLAVGWGIGHKKASVEECGEACRAHVRNPDGGNYEPLPCNAFAWCSEVECFEPDAHKHTLGDCWLKYTEGPASPEVNMRGQLDAAMKARHPTAPDVVQWHAGVLLPPDVPFGNGTWSPRHEWR